MSCNYFAKSSLSLFAQDSSANDSTWILFRFRSPSFIVAPRQRPSLAASLTKPVALTIESLGFGFARFCSYFFETC